MHYDIIYIYIIYICHIIIIIIEYYILIYICGSYENFIMQCFLCIIIDDLIFCPLIITIISITLFSFSLPHFYMIIFKRLSYSYSQNPYTGFNFSKYLWNCLSTILRLRTFHLYIIYIYIYIYIYHIYKKSFMHSQNGITHIHTHITIYIYIYNRMQGICRTNKLHIYKTSQHQYNNIIILTLS